MVLYTCETCGYSSKLLKNYERHLNRKYKCKPTDSKQVTNPKKTPYSTFHCTEMHIGAHFENACIYCGKTFSRPFTLKRHMESSCKKQKCAVTELESEKTKLILENSKLEEKVKQLEIDLINKPSIVNTTINDTNNQINNQNNTQIININSYGNEDISYITSNQVNNYLEAPYTALPNLLKNIHFHPHHPENHNIKITNRREPYAKVFKDNKWLLKDKNEVIEDIRDKGKLLLDNYRDEDKHSKFKNTCYNEFSDKLENDDKELINKIFKDIELLILNNSI